MGDDTEVKHYEKMEELRNAEEKKKQIQRERR